MFLRAKVHFFSEKPKLSDENCKNYQELSRIIDLSIWHKSRGRFSDLFVALTAKTSLRTMKTIYSFFEVSEQIREPSPDLTDLSPDLTYADEWGLTIPTDCNSRRILPS